MFFCIYSVLLTHRRTFLEYEWDEAKNSVNLVEHRIDFALVQGFDWDIAQIEVDFREDYGELREIAISFIGHALYVLVYAERNKTIRVISLRKANKKERRNFGQRAR